MPTLYLFDAKLTLRSSYPQEIGAQQTPTLRVSGTTVQELAARVGTTCDAVRNLLKRFGPIQSWMLERLILEADAYPWPPWLAITQLAAEHAEVQPSRRQVEAMRHACTRLARAALIETSQQWMEREEPRSDLPWRRRDTPVRRRHLCARIPLDAAQRERWEKAKSPAGIDA